MSATRTYYVGPHVSIGGGVERAPGNAAALGATGFGMFTKNQVQWHAAAYTAANRVQFADNLKTSHFVPRQVLPHAGYLINLANPDPVAHAKSMAAFVDELQRCAQLGLDRLNLHPGSHLRLLTPAAALTRVAASINTALGQVQGVTVVIENTAGQGGCLGHSFEELAALLRQVEDRRRIGFCLDTAHMFAAGIDIRTADGCKRMLDDFDDVVGSAFLRGMHLNDSKPGLNARVDRHAPLGDGQIGWEPFKVIMRDPRCAGLPLVLETPDEARWPAEVKRLLDLAG
jgi:deoxyribonuclease-4